MTWKSKNTEELLIKHINALCNPKLEGRLAGTDGAAEAAKYLSFQLSSMGVKPMGIKGYLQPVDVPATRLTGPVKLTVGNLRLRHRIDFGEMRLSSGGEFKGQLVVAYDGQDISEELKDRVILIPERPEGFDLESTVKAAITLGIKGLLFEEGEPRWFHKTTSVFANLGIPVIRIRKSLAAELATKAGSLVTISLPIETTTKQCHNVIGVIPGEDSSISVALTAHFDHIGDDPSGFKFPGVLDNASGTAAIIELVRKLIKEKCVLPYNLLICFLTGEESGHWGAKHLIQHQPIPLSAVINFDVLGLDPEFKEVRIGQITPEHWLSKLTAGILEENNVTVRRLKGNDDAAVFLNSKIPTIGIGEYRLHKIGPNIHTPDDQIDALHYEPLIRIIDIVSAVLTRISVEAIKAVVNI